jgi:exonuclease SbcD
MFTFLHAADLHLDSPLRGLERYEGAPVEEIRGATRRALVHLVDLALAERVAFVLIAGDLYDGDWRDYNTGLFFVAQMRRLSEYAIPVYLIAGNHDAASQITRSLALPDNVTLFSAKSPESRYLEAVGVVIHGQSFATRAVTADLAAGYPPAVPHCFNIGLLHTSVTGHAGHEAYAPCKLDALVAKGYDYWALGHVHTRAILHDAPPWVVVPGNTQGRHIRESGSKGCMLVRVEGTQVQSVDFRPLDLLRWMQCEVQLAGVTSTEEMMTRVQATLERAADALDRPLAVRLVLRGACSIHGAVVDHLEHWTNGIRALATVLGAGHLWIEEVQVQTQMLPAGLPTAESPITNLLHSLLTHELTDEEVAELAREFEALTHKLPYDFRTGEDGLDPTSPATLQAAVLDAQALLQARLAAPGGVA